MKESLRYIQRLLGSRHGTLPEALAEALCCAMLCGHSYGGDIDDIARMLRAQTGGDWTVEPLADSREKSPWRTLVFGTQGFCALVVRGTVPFDLGRPGAALEESVAGWLDNVKGILARGEAHVSYAAQADGLTAAAAAVAATAQRRGDRFVLAGHSAGGAIAVHLSGNLMRQRVWVDRVLTFGAPMPGNVSLALRVPTPVIRRFEHGRDPVPWLPGQYAHILSPGVNLASDLVGELTGKWPYSSWVPVGELWYLHPPASAALPADIVTPNGYGLSIGQDRERIAARFAELKGNRKGVVADHAMAAYIGVLRRLVQDAAPDGA